eukprot:2085452-Ditylum_brightwellii.AAC.1
MANMQQKNNTNETIQSSTFTPEFINVIKTRPTYKVKEIVLTPDKMSNNDDSSTYPKKSLEQNMKLQNCIPNWLCGRCLRFPTLLSSVSSSSWWYPKIQGGSFQNCQWVCPDCFKDSICRIDNGNKKKERESLRKGGKRTQEQQWDVKEKEKRKPRISIELVRTDADGMSDSTDMLDNEKNMNEKERHNQRKLQPNKITPYLSNYHSSTQSSIDPATITGPPPLIPRIIHQTWFEELSPSYHVHVREYIATHYPTAILEAYDALLPGAYK